MSTNINTRENILNNLTQFSETHNSALCGLKHEQLAWVNANTLKDLDIWVHSKNEAELSALLRKLGGVRVGKIRNKYRACRDVWTFTTLEPTTVSVVDVLIGHYATGATRWVNEKNITVQEGQLSGNALITDLLLKKLSKKQIPDAERIRYVSEHLNENKTQTYLTTLTYLQTIFGTQLGALVTKAIYVNTSTSKVWQLASHVLFKKVKKATVLNIAFQNGWKEYKTFLPTKAVGGIARNDTWTVTGVDGSGKSSTLNELHKIIKSHEYKTTVNYFGMIRENSKLVKISKNLTHAYLNNNNNRGENVLKTEIDEQGQPVVSRLAKIGAWVYLGDYMWRSWRMKTQINTFKLTDRWWTDLGENPDPNSEAVNVGKIILPSTKLLVELTVNTDLACKRKPEHTPKELERKKEILHKTNLLAKKEKYVQIDTTDTTVKETALKIWHDNAHIK